MLILNFGGLKWATKGNAFSTMFLAYLPRPGPLSFQIVGVNVLIPKT